jgi:hypothetical protein
MSRPITVHDQQINLVEGHARQQGLRFLEQPALFAHDILRP